MGYTKYCRQFCLRWRMDLQYVIRALLALPTTSKCIYRCTNLTFGLRSEGDYIELKHAYFKILEPLGDSNNWERFFYLFFLPCFQNTRLSNIIRYIFCQFYGNCQKTPLFKFKSTRGSTQRELLATQKLDSLEFVPKPA